MAKPADWVSARQECTAKRLFEELAHVVQQNTDTRTSVSTPYRKFEFRADGPDFFCVYRQSSNPVSVDGVAFRLETGEISVYGIEATGARTPYFRVRPKLVHERDCMYEISGDYFLAWEISKKALEGLFFGE